jgi:hypothetical protein
MGGETYTGEAEVPARSSSRGVAGHGLNGGGSIMSIMSDGDLGKRLGTAAAEAVAGHAAGGRNAGGGGGGGGGAPGMNDSDVDLLRQPLIQATGGISGLGVKQLADNDRFSCIVKYLLDFDRFKEVC